MENKKKCITNTHGQTINSGLMYEYGMIHWFGVYLQFFFVLLIDSGRVLQLLPFCLLLDLHL